MSRIRNIKPAFFKDADLFDAEQSCGLPLRVAYAGLWTVADREGRFKWRPREIKTDVLPYDDVDMALVLDGLVRCRKIARYKTDAGEFGFIHNFAKHQFINRNEVSSQLPEPPTNSNAQSVANSLSEENHVLLVVSDTDADNILTSDKSDPSKPEPQPEPKKTPYPEAFIAFWREYPTDPLMSKKKTFEQWKRLTPKDREAAKAAIPAFKDHCRKNTTYRPVHAQRFISERRFDGFAKEAVDPAELAARLDRADKIMRRGKYAVSMQ